MTTINMLVAATLLIAGQRISSAQYTFTKLAETGPDSPFARVSPAAISGNGTAVIGATRKDGLGVIYTSTGGELTKVIDTSSELLTGFVTGINSSGTIVMNATLDDNVNGIFTIRDGKLSSVYKGTDLLISDPAFINDNGDVAFAVRNGPPGVSGGSRIVINSGGTSRTVAEPAGQFVGQTLYLGQLNNLGRLTFIATPLVPLTPGTIYTAGDGPTAAAIPASSSIAFMGINAPCINDSGTIVLDAFVDRTVPTILVLEGKVSGFRFHPRMRPADRYSELLPCHP